MPKSSIAMSEVDGEYVFDINEYLIVAYSKMTLPVRREICSLVREELDAGAIEEMIDELVSIYALRKQEWFEEEDDDSE